jgi:hypothetical protein
MKYILLLLFFASCTKENCEPPQFEISGNVVRFQSSGNYTIEVHGLDNPYKGFIQVIGNAQRVEGANYKVRVKSNCSDWSNWKNK